VGLKVAVVGGGSTYTPELVGGFVDVADRLPVDELVLLDVDADRLERVGAFAGRILDHRGWSGRLTTTTDRAAAVDGADFVVLQLRVGGQEARLTDERIPLEHDCIGQETTGAGGFAKALRTVPVVLDIAEEVARRAAPDAWIVDFTNPVGIVTRSLLDRGHRAIGLCNVAIGFERRLARHLGVDSVEVEQVGLNHLTWIRAVRSEGRDVLPELLDAHLEPIARDLGMPPELVRTLGAIPSYYLRYYLLTDEVLEEQRAGDVRAAEVKRIEAALLERYADPSLVEPPPELGERGGAFYSTAAVRLLASLHDGRGDVQVVDVRNDGALPQLPDDAVVEVPARIDRDGAHPVELAPLGPEIAGLVQQVEAYERLTARAAVSGDRRTALLALLANPLVPTYGAAAGLLERLLEANRRFLPAFG
jgi:6-phospho-beta-glucosidase